jgi:hypothetical protein
MTLINDLIAVLLISERDYIFSPPWIGFLFLVLIAATFFIKPPKQRFITLAAFQIASFLIATPWVGNHVIVNLLLSITGIFYLTRPQSDSELQTKWVRQFLILFLFLYLTASLAKLNVSFFDLQTSCTNHIYQRLFKKFGIYVPVSTQAAGALIISTFIVELLVPLAAAISKFKKWLLLGLICFHIFLAIHYFEFLPIVLISILSLTPSDIQKRLSESWQQFRNQRALVLFVFTLALLHRLPNTGGVELPEAVGGLAGFLLALLISIPFIRILFNSEAQWILPRLKLSAAGGLFILILSINALAPYFGIRSIGALTMYSNLDTYLGTNHFFIPDMNLTHENEDMIELHSDVRAVLRKEMPLWVFPLSSQLLVIPKIEFGRLLARSSPAQKEELIKNIINHEVTDTTAFAEKILEDYESKPLYKKLFFGYRPQDPNHPGACLW